MPANMKLSSNPAGPATIAETPAGSYFVSIAGDQAGNYIVADDGRHQVVKISPDGQLVPVASYPVEAPAAVEDAYVRIDKDGNYILAEDNTERTKARALHVFRISPAGGVAEVPLSGKVPQSVVGLTFDAAGD